MWKVQEAGRAGALAVITTASLSDVYLWPDSPHPMHQKLNINDTTELMASCRIMCFGVLSGFSENLRMTQTSGS